MTANPTRLGYHLVQIPGFTMERFLGRGAYSTVMQATPDQEITIPRPDVQLPESFSIREVDGDGNCLFHAVADQLQSQGILTATGELYTHQTLRALAVSLVEEEPRFRQMIRRRIF